MTQLECEMALIKLGEAALEIVRMHNPEINHTSLSINDNGLIVVDGSKFDGTMLIKGNLLDAIKYSDGAIRFGGAEGAVE